MFGSYRNYFDDEQIENFYKELHTNQTVEFATEIKKKYEKLDKKMMSINEAFKMLEEADIDRSDPDIQKPQNIHSYQTAEACRALYPDEKYDWFHLVGYLHDLGKILCHPEFGEPQWAVAGDKFPLQCQISDKVIFSRFYQLNPDSKNPLYQTKYGVYQPNCGLDNVLMTFGHDEYLYMVLKNNRCMLPEEAFFIIRYHSFYAWHQHGEYDYLCNDTDRKYLFWSKEFQKCDLYSKSDENIPDIVKLKPYYDGLIKKYFPDEKLKW